MGRTTKKIPFLNKYGGQSEGTPPLNIGNEKECLYAYNVHFDVKEGKAAIIKRKGYTKINDLSIGQKIVHISQFSIGIIEYTMCIGEDGTFYSVDIDLGIVTQTRVGTASNVKWSSATLSGKHYVANETDGIWYTTDNVTWTAVGGVSPTAGLIVRFKNRLIAGLTNTVYWTELGDGTDWEDDEAIPVAFENDLDTGDSDHITGFGIIGEQLLVFKQHMFYRIFATDDADGHTAFRFIPVYGGIGAESHNAIKRIQIDNVDYLLFVGDRGIFIVGVSGNAIDITDKIQTSWNTIQKNRLSECIIVENIRNSTVYIAYTQGSQYTPSRELVLSRRTKSWSTYDIPMTSAITYMGDMDAYIIFGDKNGYLYKHDWHNMEILTDYSDDGSLITSFWQSNFMDYNKPLTFKQIQTTATRLRETTTDCPVTLSKISEDSNFISDTVSSITSLGSSLYGTAVMGTDVFAPENGYLEVINRMRMYGKSISTRFENSNNNQSMVIYGWIDELKFSDNQKGV